MNDIIKTEDRAPAAVEPAAFKVGQWLGRREAFAVIAGGCSAAEIESVRKIRDEKLYQELNCTWDECCTRYLHASRRSVERELSFLRKFGPAFFTVRQLTHITIKEYQSIAAHIARIDHGARRECGWLGGRPEFSMWRPIDGRSRGTSEAG